MRHPAVGLGVAALAVVTLSAAAASAQLTPDEPTPRRQSPPPRCCLTDDWGGRCASPSPRVVEEAYGPYDLGSVAAEARVRCRIETTTASGPVSTSRREFLSLELVDPTNTALFRKDFAEERGFPDFVQLSIAQIRGERGSGIVVEETRYASGTMPGSTLTLLVHRDGRIAPLGPPLRIVGGLEETSRDPPGPGLLELRGDHADVLIWGGSVDAHCRIAIDWARGFVLPRPITCDAGADEPTTVPRRGRILLYAEPSSKAPSQMTRIETGMPVRIRRARGRLIDMYSRPYLGLADDWIELEIGNQRGWIRRRTDVQLLGIFVERC
jgi:hypothetical protein